MVHARTGHPAGRAGRWLRALTGTAAAVVAAGVLAACGGSERDNTSDEVSREGAFPVTVEHKLGSTTIESEPTRVVTVGWNDQDYVLALGVVPVGTRDWFEDYPTYPWVQETLGDQELPTLFADEIDFEAIAAKDPDLILAIYEEIDQETYDKLTKIAPTVVQPDEYPAWETPWDAQTLLTGKALGKATEAQALVDEVNNTIAEAKQNHPEFEGKVLVVDYGPSTGGHYLIPEGDPRRALFDALGFAAQSESAEVSEERLDLLDRDVLFVNGATKEQMLASPVFAGLDVVKEDRTLYTSFDTPLSGALSYSGPDALLYALDILVPQLANAADNDPATPVEDLSNVGLPAG